ncbi:MAG: pyridoxal-phosphate dependent enzyme [Ignavibacteriales bacterium]|nr:pyridoxal-phosphate dependent enzyme [Ignavibacteriales bacterium]
MSADPLDRRIKLANLPTPIHEFDFDDVRFRMKRDDLTGVETSGNKIRKLEYLLADAKRKGASVVLTTGGEQSNHARATVFAAASQGLRTKLFLWGSDRARSEGNLFLDRVMGAEIAYLNKKDFFNADAILAEECERLTRAGEAPYVAPAGGSSPVGALGYVRFVEELGDQLGGKAPSGIFAACGSGGTAAGLLVGSALAGWRTKIFAVNVLMDATSVRDYILDLAEQTLALLAIRRKIDPSRLEVVDGYSEEGYKSIAPEKLALIKRFARSSGVLFDPTYAGKAFYAYWERFIRGAEKRRPLFLHTGGLFGAFAKRQEYLDA